MSIPPLVCSTPPPPDQCVDDKDPEDFDLSYSLSQEDDDDDENNVYNYGNFSSYNNFQSAPSSNAFDNKKQEITTTIESEGSREIFTKYESEKESEHNVLDTNTINENKLKCEEDINIEDLNLKVDEEVESIVESSPEQNEISEPNIGSLKDYDIPCNSNDSPSCDTGNMSSLDENVIDTIDTLKDLNSEFVEPEDTQSTEVITKDKYNVDDGIPPDNPTNSLNELDTPTTLEQTVINSETVTFVNTEKQFEMKLEENIIDDDFGDFDDFQSISNVASFVESTENPWDKAGSNESDFGNFTATFEENKFDTALDLATVENRFISNNIDQPKAEVNETDNDFNNLEDDDDFGDFDDFKSSSVKTESNEIVTEDSSECQELPVLNLHSIENEHQIMESISKVLTSVFIEEITEPESEFEGKLEALLSETWGHLMETDERQPYIVNWNNSLGQKTLLRALCIDSRNILFGPKWSSNMPKYAANLSNAPLQPQKQVSTSSSILTQNEIVADKSSSKPASWTDPFTSDGQESCNTETETTTITTGPTDLDVFEAALSTKPDKIYSNTMGVQPLRQINLPDTHIFTPTDSEIPRSKTIHYDRSPTVLLPQPAISDSKNSTDPVTIPSTQNVAENATDDNEYWEFQNFKSNSDTNSLPPIINNNQATSKEKDFETATTVNALPQSTIAYQTELLQPIKVEPAMPTLNWPDPGEVKGVFDDFSDFVSIPSTEIQESVSVQPAESHSETIKAGNLNIQNEITETVCETIKPDNDGFDDDFDTFQSALPTNSATDNFKSSYLGNASNPILSNQITEFDYGSPKFDNIKSDTISFASIPRPNEALNQSVAYVSNTTEFTNKSPLHLASQIQSNLLQPTPASFSAVNTQTQQKSGQILQPLSLESYSQINWPSPGIDLQDLSRFNPVETLHSLKSDLSVSGPNKISSPAHVSKNTTVNQGPDDDVWGEFVSSKPKQQQSQLKKPSAFVDDDEWTDFISSPSVNPQNGLNTISFNVHTNSNMQKCVQNKFAKKSNQPPLDIPTLNYITPKSNPQKSYNDKHFQNL